MPLRSLSLLLVLASSVQAQDDVVIAEDPPTTTDIHVLRAIYGIEHPAFAATMRAANWSSVKTFVFATPALWLGTAAFGDDRDFQPAYLMTLTEAGTIGLTFALKNVVKRPRPYASLSDIAPRARGHPSAFDPYSFPSGHAAVSFALATSASLSFPEWYVIVPSALWATSVSVSRSWLGVHYPSDITLGALMGIGVAFGVHALGDLITPGFLRGGDDDNDDESMMPRPAPPTVRFVIPLR